MARLFLGIMIGLLTASAAMRVRDQTIGPVTHELTNEECSECHFAFPGDMLPSRSWIELMNSLESHFGEDASLDQESVAEIINYLDSNSADSSWFGNRFSRDKPESGRTELLKQTIGCVSTKINYLQTR